MFGESDSWPQEPRKLPCLHPSPSPASLALNNKETALAAHAYRYECSDTPLMLRPSHRCSNSVARSVADPHGAGV